MKTLYLAICAAALISSGCSTNANAQKYREPPSGYEVKGPACWKEANSGSEARVKSADCNSLERSEADINNRRTNVRGKEISAGNTGTTNNSGE